MKQKISKREERAAELQLWEARDLRKAGKSKKALKIYGNLVSRYPDYVGALYELALIHIDNEHFDRALNFMHRAAMHNPKDFRILSNLSAIYYELATYDMAEHTCKYALDVNPDASVSWFNLGKIYDKKKEYEAAAEAFKAALELDENYFQAAIDLGQCYEQLGMLQEAADIYHRSMEMGTGDISVSLYALSDLPSSLVRVDLLAELRKLKDQPRNTTPEDELNYTFLIARALDKAGRHDQAWAEMSGANAVMRPRRRADYEEEKDFEGETLNWARDCPAVIAPPVKPADHRATPLFILGSSRSGKSTMERLIGGFDGVRCGYENHLVSGAVRAANQAAGRMSNDFFPGLPESLYPAFATIFEADLRRKAGDAAVYTTTTPGLIVNVPRIIATIPGVKFIFVKRNMMDTAIRVFQRKYRLGNNYSYDLNWTFGHIKWYHELIDSFVAKYPKHTMVFRYEDIVSNPADVAARLDGFCGLTPPSGPLPALGDDRGSSAPYHDRMLAAAAQSLAAP